MSRMTWQQESAWLLIQQDTNLASRTGSNAKGRPPHAPMLTVDPKHCSRAVLPHKTICLGFISLLRRAPTLLLEQRHRGHMLSPPKTQQPRGDGPGPAPRHSSGWEETMKLLRLLPLLLSKCQLKMVVSMRILARAISC